jgi:hypothetical protein
VEFLHLVPASDAPWKVKKGEMLSQAGEAPDKGV